MDQFKEMEQQTLSPLHPFRFEMRESARVTVMKNGHVCLHADKHYYSVHFNYIGKKVKLFYSKSNIDIYFEYELIASHERVKNPHNYTTDPTHMATYNQHIAEWNPQRYLEEGAKIHADVEAYLRAVLCNKKHPEQGYNSCKGILSFAKRVGIGPQRLIKACQRALLYNVYNYKIIETILQRNLDQFDIDEHTPPMPKHDNIRGEQYYN
jgi:hypothetical protein